MLGGALYCETEMQAGQTTLWPVVGETTSRSAEPGGMPESVVTLATALIVVPLSEVTLSSSQF